jgi:hypothetical protein
MFAAATKIGMEKSLLAGGYPKNAFLFRLEKIYLNQREMDVSFDNTDLRLAKN